MEKNIPEKINLLYIGGDTHIIDQFREFPDLFDIVTVENGLSAITRLEENKDLQAVFSENSLPGMNGIDIFNTIKAKRISRKLPFIIVSHEKNASLKKEAIKNQVDDLYFTPVNVQKIHTRLDFLIHFKQHFSTDETPENKVKEYKIPYIKRAFDVVSSSIALLLLSPLFVIIAAAIRFESKGKVFYAAKRVGTGYKIFDFYKFRSMYTGADAKLKEFEKLNQYSKQQEQEEIPEECPRCAELGTDEYCSPSLYKGGEKICEYWYGEMKKRKASSTFKKIQNDPRVTKVGNFIRNTSIDELPQLINVLKGDMSIVGNRPLPLYEAELLTSDDWSERFIGPAGITGLWQVELRGKGGEMSEEERKALDNQYARNYSFWGDIKLILRTIPAMLQKENV